jgi:hypothetical protein
MSHPSALPQPPELRPSWYDSRRQLLVRKWLLRALLVALVLGVLWVVQNWWVLRAYVVGTDRALAEVCRDSPFSSGAVTAAGGPDAITEPDHPALQPYRDAREQRRDLALAVRDHASLAGDDDLASAAAAASFLGPFPGAPEISRVEAGCARWMDRTGITP